MPFSFTPYAPPPLTNLRERLLQSKLAQVGEYERRFESSLQASIDRGAVSRSQIAVNRQELNTVRALREKLRDDIEIVRRQDAAERRAEVELQKQTPLDRTRSRRGFFRSSNERNAAMLGILERERRQSAPLTRGAFDRAKAIAASRRLYDPDASQLRGSRGSPYSPSPQDFAATQTGVDPCLDAKRVRREVMFAQQSAGIGYRTAHRGRPC